MSTTPTTTGKNGTIVVSALRARANFGKLLNRVEDERRSLIIEKRGTPKAVLMSIRDYVIPVNLAKSRLQQALPRPLRITRPWRSTFWILARYQHTNQYGC
jgi:prevent-host-death family protein